MFPPTSLLPPAPLRYSIWHDNTNQPSSSPDVSTPISAPQHYPTRALLTGCYLPCPVHPPGSCFIQTGSCDVMNSTKTRLQLQHQPNILTSQYFSSIEPTRGSLAAQTMLTPAHREYIPPNQIQIDRTTEWEMSQKLPRQFEYSPKYKHKEAKRFLNDTVSCESREWEYQRQNHSEASTEKEQPKPLPMLEQSDTCFPEATHARQKLQKTRRPTSVWFTIMLGASEPIPQVTVPPSLPQPGPLEVDHSKNLCPLEDLLSSTSLNNTPNSSKWVQHTNEPETGPGSVPKTFTDTSTTTSATEYPTEPQEGVILTHPITTLTPLVHPRVERGRIPAIACMLEDDSEYVPIEIKSHRREEMDDSPCFDSDLDYENWCKIDRTKDGAFALHLKQSYLDSVRAKLGVC